MGEGGADQGLDRGEAVVELSETERNGEPVFRTQGGENLSVRHTVKEGRG